MHHMFLTDNIIDRKSEFRKENLILALQRIRIISFGIFFFSLYFFYSDFVLLKDATAIFRKTLIAGHLVGFILSALFLLLYNKIKSYSDNIILLKFIYRGFIIILLLMGSLPSISNQRFTDNIDAYIVVILIAAVGFSFEFSFMLSSLILNHIIFIIGISIFCTNHITLVSKQINSTAMLTASILFCYSLYKHREAEFNNKQLLQESEYVFKKLFSINPLPLYITRYEDGKIIMSNDKAPGFYGYTKEEFDDFFAKELYVNRDDRALMLDKLHNLTKIDSYIVEQKCKSGTSKWIIANYELIQYCGEDCILTSVTDITELKKIENELLNHASIDSLTGIFNRRTGIEIFREKLEICRSEDTSLVVCFIDIDNLKFVNDNYGHSEGDFLINTICDCINNAISFTDVFFRYGGDEFIILFSYKNEDEVNQIWANIRTKFDELNAKNIKPYKFSASHGLFEVSSKDNLSIEEILILADKKMYTEKTYKKS